MKIKQIQTIYSVSVSYILFCTLFSSLTITPLHARPTQLPLSVSFAIEPNIMLSIDTSGSMLDPSGVGSDSKIVVVKRAVSDILDETENVRFCLSTYNPDPAPHQFVNGGKMTSGMQCDNNNNAALTGIVNNNVLVNANNSTGTPIASAYYDLTRYFRGMSSGFGSIAAPASGDQPVQYRCQSNSIIMVTDGEPTYDWNVFGNPNIGNIDLKTETRIIAGDTYSFLDPDSSQTSGLWDGKADTNADTLNVHALDDLTLFGSQIDLVPVAPHPHAVNRVTDLAGGDFDDPKFDHQASLTTHLIGFFLDTQLLKDAAKNGGGIYTTASSETALLEALRKALGSTSNSPKANGARAALSSLVLDSNNKTNLFVTEFNTNHWTGNLSKVVLTEDTNTHTLTAEYDWVAATELDAKAAADRKIFTHNGAGTVVNFDTTSLTEPLKTLITTDVAQQDAIIDFVRGSNTNEESNAGPYRTRASKLGDLVHSRPTYVRNKNFGYADLDYAEYINGTTPTDAGGRDSIVYVGGNDGMMHAFNADTGNEEFAFIPHTVLPSLASLAETNYLHEYFVDGELSIVDARINGTNNDQWGTALVSPFGAGFKGLFALNVTDPRPNNTSNRFLWENNATSAGFGAMGYILNSPKVVRVKTSGGVEKWYTIVGNGVHSEDNTSGSSVIGKAVVYVIDLTSGNLVQSIELDQADTYSRLSEGNGVTSVATIDIDADTYVDRVYAADLKGQIWRLNYNPVSELFSPSHSSGSIPQPIFKARDASGFVQAITAELTVTGPPRSSGLTEGEMIFVGTGQYFDFSHLLDDISSKTQSMYAIWDRGGWNSSSSPLLRSHLQEQSIVTTAGTRTFSNVGVNYTGTGSSQDLGWFMDLPAYGERIVRKAVGLFEHMGFFSQSPLSQLDPCLEGNNAWSMIARRDTADELDDGTPTPIGGRQQSNQTIQDPIFVQLSNGQLVSAVIDTSHSNPSDPNSPPGVSTPYVIQKRYRQAAWKRIQF